MFRLLFVNVGIISAANMPQTKGFVKTNLHEPVKRKKQFEAKNDPKTPEYSVAELYEEDSDDEFKSNSFPLTQVTYSSFTNNTENNVIKISPTAGYFCYNSSHRYLTFQVFRI